VGRLIVSEITLAWVCSIVGLQLAHAILGCMSLPRTGLRRLSYVCNAGTKLPCHNTAHDPKNPIHTPFNQQSIPLKDFVELNVTWQVGEEGT